MRVALTSFRISIAAMLGARLLGALGGVLLSQIWQNEPALASARATFSAQSLLTGNLKGTAAVGLLSGATGGIAGLLFSLSDGLRYGLALSGGAVATPAHGLPAELAFIAFPWLEFLAVSASAAGASVLFWRLWFGRRPLLQTRAALGIGVAIVASLIVAAQLEAWLLQ